jgi:hypothetical protein
VRLGELLGVSHKGKGWIVIDRIMACPPPTLTLPTAAREEGKERATIGGSPTLCGKLHPLAPNFREGQHVEAMIEEAWLRGRVPSLMTGNLTEKL